MISKECRFCGHTGDSKHFICPSCGESLAAVYLPTREEIEQGKERIQRGWTPREEMGRRQIQIEHADVIRVKSYHNVPGSRDSSDY